MTLTLKSGLLEVAVWAILLCWAVACCAAATASRYDISMEAGRRGALPWQSGRDFCSLGHGLKGARAQRRARRHAGDPGRIHVLAVRLQGEAADCTGGAGPTDQA